jgi:hypothetical protein
MITSSAGALRMLSSTAGLPRCWVIAGLQRRKCAEHDASVPDIKLCDSEMLRHACTCTLHSSTDFYSVHTAVALAYKAQIVDSVPMMEHDRYVDVLVTADGVHRISTPGQSF